ncbi:MAG TPA: TonB-dependent receptor [Chitinophagaceae bacterium]|nr:TonB-dependent receptor [Chitinophagaceae bacterium]
MKLTFAFLFLCYMHVSAEGVSQTRITLKLDKVDLKQALAAIEQKSSYRFLYNEALVRTEEGISLNAYNEEVISVLDKILNGRPITYQVLDNYLVVLKNAATADIQNPDITITGRVTGPNGEPMPNVSVTLRGTTIGTTTNAQGNFSITVPDENAVLVFSYVGYTPQEIPVRGRTAIEVSLVAADRSLDQVVVVGYGTARRRDLTGSVATVSGAEIAKQPVLTPTQAIQGRVAGVQIITSGAPNALPTVRIRGIGTTLGGQDPLYVVDGVITEDIRNINNADITSMEILKDASATAIYGMRAANGVLIITTKKGRPGKMVVNYDAFVGIREATNLVDMAGPNQYAGYLNEASVYYGTGDSLVPASRLTGTHTDWFDAILRRGFLQNHNVSMSGGSERINYFLSAGYTSEEGILITNKFNRFTVRSNNEYRLTNKLKLSSLVSFSRFDLRDVDYGAFNNAYRAAPYVPDKINGKYGNTSAAGNVGNPVLSLEKVFNNGIGNRLQGTFGLEFKPISWITFRSSLGIDLDFFKKVEYLYKFLSDTQTFIEAGGNQQRGNSRLNITDNTANKWVWDNTVQLAKSFGEHSFNLLAGVTAEQYKFNSITGGRFDVPENRDQWYLNAGSLGGAVSNETGDKWTRNSVLGRLNYNYAGRYLLTATMRADGTSRFSEDNRWGYFPSIGAGWLISDESFMDGQQIFDALKLRGSWGRVGNDKIPTSLYYTLARLNVPYYFNGQEYLGISFPDVTDKNVQWEVTEEIDLGLEFTVLNNRLSGELDWYKKETTDALVYVTIPGILGDPDSRFITNAATFENKGFEVTLNWRDNINKDLDYRIGGNVGFNKNKITGLNGGQALFAGNVGGQGFVTLSDNNQPIGSFYLLEVEGILQTEAEVAASGQSGAKVGDLNYRDVSGPAGKPDGVIDSYDRTFQGSYQPKVTFGVNGGLNYKSFDFSFAGYGTAGGKIYNGKRAIRGADARDNIEAEIAKERWTPNNPNTSHPRATLNQMAASTYFLEKGNFFRLNNLTLGYTLSERLLSRVRINSVRVYFTAQNLFTITPYSGFTPELQTDQILEAGIESNSYPSTRTFAFGLNIGF